MKKGVFWLTLTGIIVISLVLASCGKSPTATTTTTTSQTTATATTPTTVKTTATTTVATTTKTTAPTSVQVEKPKYGGTFTVAQGAPITVFMPIGVPGNNPDANLYGAVYEQYLSADLTMGLGGTGEVDYGSTGGHMGQLRYQDTIGIIAERAQTPKPGVWVLDIRKGMRFALDPGNEASRLAAGRELTADDIVWITNYMNTAPGSRLLVSRPDLAKATKVEKTGPWQVTIDCSIDPGSGYQWTMGGGFGGPVTMAKEVIEKYGNTNDWKNVVSTGPYMIKDYVDGSSLTLKRNPNYWGKNPTGPGKGDQLPYLDEINILIMPDLSTRMSALRTAKVDRIGAAQEELDGESAELLMKQIPDIKNKSFPAATMAISMRLDKQNLPFKDKKVRQALMMGIDYNEFVNAYYGGKAYKTTVPVAPVKGAESLYWPIETLPEAARTLFTYNPTKAKQLLAEAGYPNGFKTNMVVNSTTAGDVDSVAIIKNMWTKIGVDLEIKPTIQSTYNTMLNNSSWDEMFFHRFRGDLAAFGSRVAFSNLRGAQAGMTFNNPAGTEPVIEGAYQEMQKYLFVDNPKADKIFHDMIPYLIEQAYFIPRPTPYAYRLWWPWLKNYYGEGSPRYYYGVIWIDQDLKKQMGK